MKNSFQFVEFISFCWEQLRDIYQTISILQKPFVGESKLSLIINWGKFLQFMQIQSLSDPGPLLLFPVQSKYRCYRFLCRHLFAFWKFYFISREKFNKFSFPRTKSFSLHNISFRMWKSFLMARSISWSSSSLTNEFKWIFPERV